MLSSLLIAWSSLAVSYFLSPEETSEFYYSLKLDFDSFFLASSISVIFPFIGVVLISLIGLECVFYCLKGNTFDFGS